MAIIVVKSSGGNKGKTEFTCSNSTAEAPEMVAKHAQG